MLTFDPTFRISVNDALRLRYFANLFEEEDMAHDTRHSPIDWAFDSFEPTKKLLQNYIYCECVSFNPEIVERDRIQLQAHAQDSHCQDLMERVSKAMAENR